MRNLMSSITAVVLAAFVGYGAAWYFGLVEGNFSLLLFLATVVTGVYWVAERFYFLPQRHLAVVALEESVTRRQAELAKQQQEQARQAQFRQEQIRQEQARQEQARLELARQEQVKQEQSKQEQLRQDQAPQEKSRLEQLRHRVAQR